MYSPFFEEEKRKRRLILNAINLHLNVRVVTDMFFSPSATMMWTIGMADRDHSQDSTTAGVSKSQTNPQTDDVEEVRNATESGESTNENAEHAVRAIGNRGENEEQEAGNDPQQVTEEEESKS